MLMKSLNSLIHQLTRGIMYCSHGIVLLSLYSDPEYVLYSVPSTTMHVHRYTTIIHYHHTLPSYTTIIHYHHTLPSYTTIIHYSYTTIIHYHHTLLIHYHHTLPSYTTHTLPSYTTIIHYHHTLPSYTTHTLPSYTTIIHYSYTTIIHYSYTTIIHYSYTSYSYTTIIHYHHTLLISPVYSVKPAVFDLVLALSIASYSALVYLLVGVCGCVHLYVCSHLPSSYSILPSCCSC